MFWLLSFILLVIVSPQALGQPDLTTPAMAPSQPTEAKPTVATGQPMQPSPPASAGTTTSTTVASTTKAMATTATDPKAPTTLTPTSPTVATTTKESDPFDIDQMLRDIIRRYEADCQGNAELTFQLDQIRFALKLGNEYSAIKNEALTNFKVYNAIRLLLEKRITERIDELNDLLPTLKPKSECSQFYLKQRNDLKEIGKLSNAEKQARLTQNSVVCPNVDSDYDYDDYFDIFDYIF